MKLLATILFVIFSHFSDKTVTIKVIDNDNHEELIGAKVTIDDQVYYTDFYGEVKVEIDEDEKYEISIESESYKTRSYINLTLNDNTFGLIPK